MSEEASRSLRFGVVAAAALLYLLGLGQLGASAPDEPRYLQVAEEMRSGEHGAGGWLLLHLNGEPYTQKPPLYYWLAAAFGAPQQRVTELAGRLPSALSGIGVALLTLLLGTKLFGGRVAVVACCLLATAFQFAHLARRVQLDVLLALCEGTALVAFWWLDRGISKRAPMAALFHTALGLGVLAKGPVGFLLPVLSVLGFLAWERRLRDIARVFPWWGFALSLAPGLAWFAAANALAPTGFAGDAIGTNLVGRFFQGTSHERPFYYYLRQFPADFLPWSLLFPLVFVIGRREVFRTRDDDDLAQRAWRFLLASVGASLLFFSLSSGKRGLYLIPVFPAAALLCADALSRWLAGRARPPLALSLGAGFGALVFAALGVVSVAIGARRPLFALPFLAEMTTGYTLAFGIASLAIVGAALATWIVLGRWRASAVRHFAVLIAAVFALELAVFTLLFPALDAFRSPREIALAAAAHAPEGTRVGLFGDRAMVGGLVYYGGRPVAELHSKQSVRRFVAEGGRAIVAKRRKLRRLGIEVDVVASVHPGKREVVVAVPRAAAELR